MDKKRKKLFPWILLVSGALLLLAGLAFAWQNRPNAVPASPTLASVEDVPRVSLADAKAAFDAGTAIFLDVRDSSSYAGSHIPGAVLISLSDLSARMGELDPSAWIIPYCT